MGWIDACQALTADAIDEGDLLPSIDPPAFARFVIAAFTGVRTVSQVLADCGDLERRVDEMWVLLLPGIMPAVRHQDIARIRAARATAVVVGEQTPA
ncbi:hypothetical protein MLGJGCBP_00248 [Rhodococcus sp. T7]|nr:hypothetical protein MLGJGCBP_10178 [Rhodococcus sp. T7]KAF0966573.1 hypothetical protein MLGJGCBP_00248 [Rhodococcus sp. T7]